MDENFHFFGWNFAEISGFGGWWYERGGRNVDGRNFAKFRLKLAKKWLQVKNRRNLQKIVSHYNLWAKFLFALSIFPKNRRLHLLPWSFDSTTPSFLALFRRSRSGCPGRLHLLPWSSDSTTPSFPALIWWSWFGPNSNGQFHVHLMVQIEFGCDPTVRIEPQQLYDDPMVKFRPNFNPIANFVLQQ